MLRSTRRILVHAGRKALPTIASLAAVLFLVGQTKGLDDCSKEDQVEGNACGPSSTCAQNKCGSWFLAEADDGDDPFMKCQAGTNPNANCVGNTPVTCGSGGDCLAIINGKCSPTNGAAVTTPTVKHGGPCNNPG